MRKPITLYGVFIMEDRRERRLDTVGVDSLDRALKGMLPLTAEFVKDQYLQHFPDSDIYVKATETIVADELMR